MSNNHLAAGNCTLEVQPPTPILCNNTFQDCIEQQQQPAEGNSFLAASNNTKNGSFLNRESSSNGSNWEMTNEDTLSSSGSGSNPGDRSARSSVSHRTHDPYLSRSRNGSSQNLQAQLEQPQQPQQQGYPVSGAGVPPSLRQASQSRRRQEDEALFSANSTEEMPVYEQQQQSGFVAHHSQQQEQPAMRRQGSNTAASSKPFPECCYHKALVNRMEFIQPPVVREAGSFGPNTRSTNFLRVFIGQCRFESTPAEIRWLVHYLTGIQPVKVELRGTGCFMAYVSNYEEVYTLLALKEKLLFDHTGVWYAREEDQQSFLRRYVTSYVSAIGKGFRLPKDMVVLHDQQQVQQQQRNNKHGHHYSQGFQGGNHYHHNNQYQQQQQPTMQPRSAVNNFYQQEQHSQYQQQQPQYQQQQQPQYAEYY